jgi:transcriptional regulator
MGSLRQDLLQHLREKPCTLRELALGLGLREKETSEHLGHARHSLEPGERLREEPAQCLACGFSFTKRERLTTPSRCPRCRSERIRPATFSVEGT